MNKVFYIYRAKFGNSKRFQTFYDNVKLQYPSMKEDSQIGFGLQLYYEYAKRGGNLYLNRILRKNTSPHKLVPFYLEYFRLKYTDSTFQRNWNIWEELSENN